MGSLEQKFLGVLRNEPIDETVPEGFVLQVMHRVRSLARDSLNVRKIEMTLRMVEALALGLCAIALLLFGLMSSRGPDLGIAFEYAVQAGIDPWLEMLQIR